MITLDGEPTANCKATENEVQLAAGADMNSALQTSLKDAQNNSISDDALKNNSEKVKEPVRNGVCVSEDDQQHQDDVNNGDCAKPTSSGENGYVDSADKKDTNGLDVSDKDIIVEDESCENKERAKTVTTAEDSSKTSLNVVECIELDDDDDEVDSGEPPAKKKKGSKSPVPDDPDTQTGEKKPELTSSEALLNKLEAYVKEAIDRNVNVERKVLDALLGAINIQVQREPLSVRKLILDKQLVLPNTISFPPSQVVDLLIEHDPDKPLSKVIGGMFGDERPKLSEAEKRERHLLKLGHPAPHMTKLLMDIGQDLVQESTYSDIVHAKNLPETPKNMETYKQVAQQLKPVWEALRKKNEPYKLKQYTCQLCNFRTESRIILAVHRQTPHFDGRKYQCALCPEFFTNENMIAQHYLKEHNLVAGKEEAIPRNPCPCCDEDFMYKGQRDQHLKMCRRDLNRVRLIMAPKHPQDVSAINHWLWDKPPVDPTILQQQQVAQRQQAEKLQRAQLAQQQQQLQQRRSQTAVSNSALLAAQQQQAALLLQQQRIRAAQAAAQQQQQAKMFLGNPSVLAVMQQQLQRAAVSSMRTPAMPVFTQRGIASGIRGPTVAQHAAASLAGRIRAPSQVPAPRAQLGGVVPSAGHNNNVCEICDQNVQDRDRYLTHLQLFHKQMRGKTSADMQQGAPLACSRCRDRFWTYEGLERHLVMAHGLVTSDLLTKAQKKEDGGRCKHCGKQYAFNMLQHLVTDHQVKLCSAEIMYSCDVCAFKCSSYSKLEVHLNTMHPKNPTQNSTLNSAITAPSDEKFSDAIRVIEDEEGDYDNLCFSQPIQNIPEYRRKKIPKETLRILRECFDGIVKGRKQQVSAVGCSTPDLKENFMVELRHHCKHATQQPIGQKRLGIQIIEPEKKRTQFEDSTVCAMGSFSHYDAVRHFRQNRQKSRFESHTNGQHKQLMHECQGRPELLDHEYCKLPKQYANKDDIFVLDEDDIIVPEEDDIIVLDEDDDDVIVLDSDSDSIVVLDDDNRDDDIIVLD